MITELSSERCYVWIQLISLGSPLGSAARPVMFNIFITYFLALQVLLPRQTLRDTWEPLHNCITCLVGKRVQSACQNWKLFQPTRQSCGRNLNEGLTNAFLFNSYTNSYVILLELYPSFFVHLHTDREKKCSLRSQAWLMPTCSEFF